MMQLLRACVGDIALTHNDRATKVIQEFRVCRDPRDRREDKGTEEIEGPLVHRSERKGKLCCMLT